MLARLSLFCFLLFATATAAACSCREEKEWLGALESHGFLPADVEIFHGKVERWCVFRRSVTGHFGIVTGDFGNVTGHFGDVTDGPSAII
jgi:hypothetical protein